MKIVITGGLGYIGMELAKLYSGKSRVHSVSVIDKSFYSQRVAQIKRWGIDFIQADILDEAKMKQHLADADIIYHLAGITDVSTTVHEINKKKDIQVRDVGINGTKNILKYCSNNSKIIFPSTHVIFEGLKKVKSNIDENFEPMPVLEYAKGKAKSEQDIANSGKKFVILRLGSVYGNSYDSTRLNIMPNLFTKITSENGTIKLFSKGEQLKSLVAVKDVARAMMYTGENQQIKNQVFNVVSENLTVRQVAEICKKINKKLTIELTNDPVPNKGYALSNQKLKKEGFKFLYNFKDEASDFISDIKNIEKIYNNELIEYGTNNFVDGRGIISNYYMNDYINMIGYVESKKRSVRGNHYHPIQTQKCLLIKGKYVSITKDLMNPNSVVETRLVSEGEMSTIPPYVAHTMVFLEDSIFLNLVNGEREHDNYGITHTLKYNLVENKLSEDLLDTYKTECRVCEGGLNHYLSLGLTPLANNLNSKKNDNNDLYPLDLNFCKQCYNSQLSVAVPAEKMFNDYVYLSSTSEQFRSHFIDTAKELKTDLKLTKKSIVVDIGSNDGVFLAPLKKLGIKAIGVEPAKNIAKIANSNNLVTIPQYFSKKTVNKIIDEFGKVDLVTGFNVFAHNDELKDMLINIEDILKKDGEFIFEIQYLLKTINDLTFDNIYHEHFNYWCLLSILHFFEDTGMKVYKVKEVNTHGGSLRVYATKNKNKKRDKSVNKYIELERKQKLDKIETYFKFAKDVENIKENSLKRINKILEDEKKIVGYGAPAKATTVLNYFGLDENHFSYTIDDNLLKQNKYIPGTNIQIKSISEIEGMSFDYILVLAWNFFDSIKENNKKIFKKSRFIKLK